ncbi:hypothetical protein DU002_14660 [Corallincola holothuriorum]|uniref:Lipoprotein n=1 Tax=Corallincola holothuriorum TaxID=2282215 RepID=A0A368N5A0_9GAMM|nr:hypothetical protein [Corallincola holothuriorum]RCU45698.1 hypothetical protein DU002_14660 [Corallincola holothuriorum]
MRRKSYLIAAFFSLLITTACAEDGSQQEAEFGPLKCLGTEPFWSLELKDRTIVLEDMDSVQGQFKLTKAITSSNHTNRWFLTATGADSASVSVALSKTNQCSDGMSDFSYEYEVMLLTPEQQLLSGCCNRIESAK